VAFGMSFYNVAHDKHVGTNCPHS